MRVSGDKELAAALRVLGRGLPSGAIDRSAVRASKPMLDEAITRAKAHRQPRRPKGGHIDENIKVARKKESTRTRRQFVFGAFGPRKSILRWLELGTLPHFQPRRFGGIFHPGARRFPIMRPAYDNHSDKTINRFGMEIWKEIERLVSKAKRSGRR